MSERRAVGERREGAVTVRGGGVSGGVGGDVGGLQVGYLRGVNHAAVVRQGSRAVFDQTWRRMLILKWFECCRVWGLQLKVQSCFFKDYMVINV